MDYNIKKEKGKGKNMGRWSLHPMGSDSALDARDGFMEDFNTEEIYFFERPEEEIRNLLLNLSLDEIKEKSERYDYVSCNKFAIPYTFIDYKAYPTDPEIKKFLLECLDSYDGSYSSKETNAAIMRHINVFKENFEDIISGKKELDKDPGLFAAIAEHISSGKDGLVNIE